MAAKERSPRKRAAAAKAPVTVRPRAPAKAADSAAATVPAKPAASLRGIAGGADTVVSALTAERDSLKQELALAHAKIADLERRRLDAVNRIDWVIDSLRSVMENEPK